MYTLTKISFIVLIGLVAICQAQQNCTESSDCTGSTERQFCFRPVGVCSGLGQCVARVGDATCDNSSRTVCGCNGKTYLNECDGYAHGFSISFRGACNKNNANTTNAAGPDACTSQFDCQPAQYCRTPLNQCNGTGICINRGTGCSTRLSPVCGCNGVTYDNACSASNAGAAVLRVGRCNETTSTPDICVTNSDCEGQQFCSRVAGQCSSANTRCINRQRISSCSNTSNPVCGCDGRTYNNECFASANGTSVDYNGNCGAGGSPPGSTCADNSECRSQQYCAAFGPIGTCGSGSSRCINRQRAYQCSDLPAAVCGCDGETYLNACFASVFGTSVASNGPCSGN